jgi:hypothetical protein
MAKFDRMYNLSFMCDVYPTPNWINLCIYNYAIHLQLRNPLTILQLIHNFAFYSQFHNLFTI